jgi:23S rRNA (uracil1939-C5)-methyltransferase
MARNKDRKPVIWEKINIHGLADKGKGVGRTEDGRVVFVEQAAPGDVIDVRMTKKKAGVGEGYPVFFHEKSTERQTPFCEHFGVCGGCKLQHIDYDAQIKHKDQIVFDALTRIGKVKVGEFLPIIGAAETLHYRNKLEFTFSNKQWLTDEMMAANESKEKDVLGFHRPGAFDKIVHINHCSLMRDPMNDIRLFMHDLAIEQALDYFDMKTQEGFLRVVMIRITTLGQILVVIQFAYEDEDKRKKYLDAIIAKFPQITSLQYCINSSGNDSLYGKTVVVYSGKSYIEEDLRDVRFRIGSQSFFQTSTQQAINLFDVVVKFAELNGSENVYDLYTGVGSIGLYIAKNCKQVVGIEEIEEAIKDAKENAQRNEIHNTVFYAGDVKNILTDEFASQHGKPDLLITDPPRAGMHEKVVEMLLKLAAPRIVYVSCNPSTQARDLQLLSEKYEVVKSQAVDMFPYTHHIENVVLLKLK